MGAALDWLAILEGAASIAAVKLFAKILWATYKKFIKPLKDKGRDNSFLYVVIENEKKEFVQFALGKDYQDEEIFVRDFTEKVERIRVVSDSAEIEIEKREIKISEIWKEI